MQKEISFFPQWNYLLPLTQTRAITEWGYLCSPSQTALIATVSMDVKLRFLLRKYGTSKSHDATRGNDAPEEIFSTFNTAVPPV